ncbi:MAG: hypothetical protein JW850_14370 [Thermoflexales bacterium]|nr:hypothetical protein [Thermoflexales bacterium]
MNDEILVRLLLIEAEHDEKLKQHEEAINDEYWNIDLIEVVLDAIGVPADNSVELKMNFDHPDFFCRDWFYHKWGDIKDAGATREAVEDYLAKIKQAVQDLSERS